VLAHDSAVDTVADQRREDQQHHRARLLNAGRITQSQLDSLLDPGCGLLVVRAQYVAAGRGYDESEATRRLITGPRGTLAGIA
jgi:hypothetical protein